MSDWTGRRVLVSGVCGTVGREILRQLVTEVPTEIIGIDNNESELFFLQQETSDLDTLVTLSLGDVRDAARLHRVMEGVDTVLHAAALKHVHLCEQSPRDAIKTNVLGAQNIVDAAEANSVERVVLTSSDKAVNPTSVMGTSKLMGERLFTAAYLRRRGPRPIFASTRFGNVLGSRGSVIPLFHRQVRDGGPVTITDLDMTRFIMTLREAVKLTMDSVFLAQGGEVFVTKMQVLRIEDLAHAMIEELAPLYGHAPDEIRIEIIGAKMGEKLWEELLNEEEVRRAEELPNHFLIHPVVPTTLGGKLEYVHSQALGTVEEAYNSAHETPMTRAELRTYLREHDLLEVDGHSDANAEAEHTRIWEMAER